MGAVLAIDTSSPVVSVAAAATGGEGATRAVGQRESSPILLELVDEVLAELGLALPDLDGLLALAGPGSFTGIRIGLATALGLHQATGVAATAVSTLRTLAAAVDGPDPVLAAVPAGRGAWFLQRFAGRGWKKAVGEPVRIPPTSTVEDPPEHIVTHHPTDLARTFAIPAERVVDPGPLAPVAARLALLDPLPWATEALTRPIYLAPPAVRPPGPPKPVLGSDP